MNDISNVCSQKIWFYTEIGGKNANVTVFQEKKPQINLNCENIDKYLIWVFHKCIRITEIPICGILGALGPYFKPELEINTAILYLFQKKSHR